MVFGSLFIFSLENAMNQQYFTEGGEIPYHDYFLRTRQFSSGKRFGHSDWTTRRNLPAQCRQRHSPRDPRFRRNPEIISLWKNGYLQSHDPIRDQKFRRHFHCRSLHRHDPRSPSRIDPALLRSGDESRISRLPNNVP